MNVTRLNKTLFRLAKIRSKSHLPSCSRTTSITTFLRGTTTVSSAIYCFRTPARPPDTCQTVLAFETETPRGFGNEIEGGRENDQRPTRATRTRFESRLTKIERATAARVAVRFQQKFHLNHGRRDAEENLPTYQYVCVQLYDTLRDHLTRISQLNHLYYFFFWHIENDILDYINFGHGNLTSFFITFSYGCPIVFLIIGRYYEINLNQFIFMFINFVLSIHLQ